MNHWIAIVHQPFQPLIITDQPSVDHPPSNHHSEPTFNHSIPHDIVGDSPLYWGINHHQPLSIIIKSSIMIYQPSFAINSPLVNHHLTIDQPSIYHLTINKPSLTIIINHQKHHWLLSSHAFKASLTVINHHQPSSTIVNPRQPSSYHWLTINLLLVNHQ